MLIENPLGYYNPYRKKRGGKMRKNPTTTALTRQWFQGIDMMDAGAALGGLAASTMLPGMIVKDTSTGLGKLWKILAAAGSTVVAGYVFKNVSSNAGKMAIAGGLAGTLSQTIAMFTNINIGRPRLAAPRFAHGIGQTVVPEFEDVKIS